MPILGSGIGLEREDQEKIRTKETSTFKNVRDDNDEPENFQRFWAVYPKKVARRDALKAWRQIKPSTTTLYLMLDDVTQRIDSVQWRKQQGEFIPYPATYLRGRRWEDEKMVPTSRVPWTCAHTPHCLDRGACWILQQLGR